MLYTDTLMMEELLVTLIPAVISGVPTYLFGIAAYVLSALALYTLAKRRGIPNAWFSWVPVLNTWILGSLSDQYRYVVKGQYKSKRKVLLIMSLIQMLLSLLMTVLAIYMVVELVDGAVFSMDTEFMLEVILGSAVMLLVLALPLAGVAIAAMVIRYMALYDVYTSMDPGNNVLFLVLSIFFQVTEPFFLFFNRNKDEGMPPRKQPAAAPREEQSWQPPRQEPQWQPPCAEPREDTTGETDPM